MAKFDDLETILSFLPDFTPLEENADAYFLQNPASIEIPLANLISTRLRPDGVRNAANLMFLAARGENEKREPITVSKQLDGSWEVVDGNSTVAVARASCWYSIPCKPLL